MRRLLVAPVCLLVFCGGWCFGQTSVVRDGTTWKSLDSSDRVFYVSGFVEGYFAGFVESYKQTLNAIATSSLTLEEKRKLLKLTEKVQIESAAGPSAGTIGQLEATLSTFYDDYRNMPVCWADAVMLSAQAIKGNGPTEQELNAARKKDAESGCK